MWYKRAAWAHNIGLWSLVFAIIGFLFTVCLGFNDLFIDSARKGFGPYGIFAVFFFVLPWLIYFVCIWILLDYFEERAKANGEDPESRTYFH